VAEFMADNQDQWLAFGNGANFHPAHGEVARTFSALVKVKMIPPPEKIPGASSGVFDQDNPCNQS